MLLSSVIAVSLLLICNPVLAGEKTGQDSSAVNFEKLPSDSLNVVVTIERMLVTNQRLHDTLLVTLQANGQSLAGFDFKIGIDNPLVDIIAILPGEIYDSCRWEYFTARQVNTSDKEPYPPILWQVVALAELIPDEEQPLCHGLNRKASLLKLVVSNEHVLNVPDTAVPIFFFWEDCGDNSISSRSGNTLLLSKQVFDYFGAVPPQSRGIFPTRSGAPSQCINPGSRNKPVRKIEFHNGGIEFRMNIEDTTSDKK